MKEFGERLKSKCQLLSFSWIWREIERINKKLSSFVEYHDWYAAYTHIDVPGHWSKIRLMYTRSRWDSRIIVYKLRHLHWRSSFRWWSQYSPTEPKPLSPLEDPWPASRRRAWHARQRLRRRAGWTGWWRSAWRRKTEYGIRDRSK